MDWSISKKKELIDKVKKLNEKDMIMIYNIIKKHTDSYSHNNNGVFVNMKYLNNEALDEINEIINDNQNNDTMDEFKEYEKERNDFMNKYKYKN